MKYRDYELYLNNPTLSYEEQDNFDRGTIFQIGLISSLPPAALLIMNRARTMDRRRHRLSLERDHLEKVKRGFGNIGSPRAQANLLEGEEAQKLSDMRTEIDSIRAMQTDPNVPEQVLRDRTDALLKNMSKTVKDLHQRPYDIYGTVDGAKQARTLDILLNTEEYNWNRALAGASVDDNLKRLDDAVILVEHRNVIGNVHAPKRIEDLTISGQKFHSALQDVLAKASNNKEGGFNIEIVPGQTGSYKFKVTMNEGILRGSTFTLDTHQFAQDHHLMTAMKTGNFDSALTNAHRYSNNFQVDSQLRHTVVPMRVRSGKAVINFATDRAYGARGSATNFFEFLKNVLGRDSTTHTAGEIVQMITQQNAKYYSDTDNTIAFGKSEDSMLNANKVIAQDSRFTPDKKMLTAQQIAQNTGFNITKKKDYRAIEQKAKELFFNHNGVVYYETKDAAGRPILVDSGKVVAGRFSSPSGISEGRVVLEEAGQIFHGGSIYGKKALMSNIVAGAGTDFLFEDNRQKFLELRAQGKDLRKKAVKEKLFRGTTSKSRLGFLEQRIINRAKREGLGELPEAAFRSQETIVMVGENAEKLGVSRDQAIQLVKHGGNSVADLMHNRNIDMMDVAESIIELERHTVHWDPSAMRFTYERGGSDYRKAGELKGSTAVAVKEKIEYAMSPNVKQNFVDLTKAEVEHLGLKASISRKTADGDYRMFFSKEKRGARLKDSGEIFRFFDGENSLVGEEANKVNIKTTFANRAQEQVSHHAEQEKVGAEALYHLNKRLSNTAIIMGNALVEKEYDTQLAEGAFKKVLKEVLKLELNGDKSIEKNVYGQYATARVNKGAQEIIEFSGRDLGNKNILNMVDKLFAKVVLDRDLGADGAHPHKLEKIFKFIRVRRNADTGQITKVDYEFHNNASQKLTVGATSRKILNLIQDHNIQGLKKINDELHQTLAGFKAAGADLFYTDGVGTYANYVESFAVGGFDPVLKKTKVQFYQMDFGHGTPEGHQVYSSYAEARIGKYGMAAGPKMNMFDIESLQHINPVHAAHLKQMQVASYKYNKEAIALAAEMNRKLSSTMQASQPPSVKMLREHLKGKIDNRLFEKLTAKAKKDVFNIDSLATDVADTFNAKSDPSKILDIVRQAKAKGTPSEKLSDVLMKELGLNEFYIDNKEALSHLKAFSTQDPVTTELFGNKDIKISAIHLSSEVPLFTTNSGKTDMLFYRAINVEKDLVPVSVNDQVAALDGIFGQQREIGLKNIERRLQMGTEVFMLNEYAADVLRVEYVDKRLKYLKNLQKSGNLTKGDMEHLQDSIYAMEAIISKSANRVVKTQESEVYGKAAELGKVVTQFSANLKIQRSDYLHDVVEGLDWRTIVVGRQQAGEMARSHFIMGKRAMQSLKEPALFEFVDTINKKSTDKLRKHIDSLGSPFKDMIEHTFDEIEAFTTETGSGNRRINQRKAQLKKLARRLEIAQDHATNLVDWEGSKYQRDMRVDVERIKSLGQVVDYKNITQLRTMFSEDGLYGKIRTAIGESKSEGSERTIQVWDQLKEIMDRYRISNNKKYVDQGRLWEGWRGIGDRLQEKNNLELVTKAIQEATSKMDPKGRAESQALLDNLTEIANRVAAMKQHPGKAQRQYAREFGDVAELMMVHDDIAANAPDVQKVMRAKVGNESQLSARIKVIRKAAGKKAGRFMAFGALTRQMDSLMSFDTDAQITELAKLSDDQIDAHAKTKVDKLIANAEAVAREVIQSPRQDQATKDFGERIAGFINTLKGHSEDTSFTKELQHVMKGMKGLYNGMSTLGKADPDIYSTKHMQYFTLKMLLESDLKNLPEEHRVGVTSAMRSGKAFISHVAAKLLDRDFDGDSINLYASIIDQRFGIKKGNLSVANVVAYMNDFSFSFEKGSFIPTNATSAVKSELLFNEKLNAGVVTMDTVKNFIRKRMLMEQKSIGFLDKDPITGDFNLEDKIKEAENKWLVSNHGRKKRTDLEREALLSNTYIPSDVKNLVDRSETSEIRYGDQSLKLSGNSREVMSMDAYAKKILNRYGIHEIGTDRQHIKEMAAYSQKITEASMKHTGGTLIHDSSAFTKALLSIEELDFKAQSNLGVQKDSTGKLYKYPTLMRSIADTLIKEGSAGANGIQDVGRAMAEHAQKGTYEMQQHIAIGMKAGGVDATEGVDLLFRDVFNLSRIEDQKIRGEKLNDLYKRLSKEGLYGVIQGPERDFMTKIGYNRFVTGSHQPATPTHMKTMEMLKFSHLKETALQSLISGDPELLRTHLTTHYGEHKPGLNEFAERLTGSLTEEANLKRSAAMTVSGEGSLQDTYKFMLQRQANSSKILMKSHQNVVAFSSMGIHSIANMIDRAQGSGELIQLKQMLGALGSTLGSEGKDLLPEQLRKAQAENSHKGLTSNILGSLLHFMNTGPESAQADAVMNLISSGRDGHDVMFKALNRPSPSLMGRGFASKAAAIGIGILGLGTLAPSPSVGRNPNSVVDKRDEYSTVLPEKMIGQYNNQANVVQVNPWVANRLKQEKAESARFNHMFYKTLTG